MTYTIYGLRLKGSKEVRYIGLTNGHPIARLAAHVMASTGRTTPNKAFTAWIRENRDGIEVFAIANCDTLAEARGIERAIIALCARLDQRLLNIRCMPANAKPALAVAA